MLTINQVTKHFGGQTLFRDASITFSKGANYGIVGANGSGKSTLLRILTGEEEPSAGELSVPRRARLGVLKQDHFQYEETRILDVVMMGHGPVWNAMQERDALLENAENEFDADKYSALEEIIMQHDGYALEARAAEILAGLNVPDEVHEQPLSVLSGGFKLRVLLAQTLAGLPDVLLLDEPTNHLDILSIRWLEKFLESFKGTSMVVSHDHRFLNNVCTHIVDVDYERVTVYKGNYNDFVEAKQTDRDRMEAEIGKREKEIADHKRFVEKFKAKPTKARQAQSRAKVIDKIVIEELPNSSRRYPTFQLEARRPSGKQVVEIEGISKAYGDKQVLSDVSLRVMRDDRLAIIGPNGIGKSTLLKILVGELQADAGSVEWGYETHPGYFAQDHSEVLARQKGSIQEWLWDQVAGETIGYIRGRLAQVLFQKDEVEKKVANLSGGERARLIFAQLGVLKPNVLILDEPTNHLDLEGIEALAQGIEEYDGTTIFVSHDRWFVNRLATRVLEITPEKLNDFQGTYDEYLAKLGDDHLDVDAVVRQARRDKRKAKNA
ncbi:ABC transporter ATP-binding protein [Acidobacteria bacterium Mor1]|nr:ABC transporter ATP-binding protein [Acidobacteria bacterium Mor1]